MDLGIYDEIKRRLLDSLAFALAIQCAILANISCINLKMKVPDKAMYEDIHTGNAYSFA